MRAERSRDVTGASPPRRRPNERADVAEFHFKTRASGAGNSIGVPHGGSMCCGGALRLNGATRGAVAPIRCASSRNAPVAPVRATLPSRCARRSCDQPVPRAGRCGPATDVPPALAEPTAGRRSVNPVHVDCRPLNEGHEARIGSRHRRDGAEPESEVRLSARFSIPV